MLHAEGVKGNGKGYEFRQRLHIETSMLGGTILPNHSGHQIHPQQQVLEARVVAPRESQYLSPVRMTVEAVVRCESPIHLYYLL